MARIDVLSGNRKFFTVPFFITFVTIFLAAIAGDTTQVTKSEQKTLQNSSSLQLTQETLPTTTPFPTLKKSPTITITPSPTPKPTAKPTLKPLPTRKPIIVYPTPTPTQKPIQVPVVEEKPAPVNDGFSCDCSRTCKQISSCSEAQYQLNTCGCSVRDADNDGIACDAAPLHCQH